MSARLAVRTLGAAYALCGWRIATAPEYAVELECHNGYAMLSHNTHPWSAAKPTAVLVFADGSILKGQGYGAIGSAVGEVCFNTAMSGYQEILTDPSYTDQIITFTFPHIGNTGVTDDDMEMSGNHPNAGVRGVILRAAITMPSNHRSQGHFNDWLTSRNIIALVGIDTRALTIKIRKEGAPNAVIAHDPDGEFDLEALQRKAKEWPGLDGTDIARNITCSKVYEWSKTSRSDNSKNKCQPKKQHRVVVLDFGIKSNILQCLADVGCQPIVIPVTISKEDIASYEADAYLLSNGPGDPAATAEYAIPIIRTIIDSGKPMFGICIGHQLLALALGANTVKMYQGHHSSNHPVKDIITGKIDITSMNHGFTVNQKSLPSNVEETHISLFDGTNCGLRIKDAPIFSVQHHPEASPGPHDARYLFTRFVNMIRIQKNMSILPEIQKK